MILICCVFVANINRELEDKYRTDTEPNYVTRMFGRVTHGFFQDDEDVWINYNSVLLHGEVKFKTFNILVWKPTPLRCACFTFEPVWLEHENFTIFSSPHHFFPSAFDKCLVLFSDLARLSVGSRCDSTSVVVQLSSPQSSGLPCRCPKKGSILTTEKVKLNIFCKCTICVLNIMKRFPIGWKNKLSNGEEGGCCKWVWMGLTDKARKYEKI